MLIALSSSLSFQWPSALVSALRAPSPTRQILSSEKARNLREHGVVDSAIPDPQHCCPFCSPNQWRNLALQLPFQYIVVMHRIVPPFGERSQSFMSENCSKLFLPQEIVIVVILHLILFSFATICPAPPCLVLLALAADGRRRPSRARSTWGFLSLPENRFSFRVSLPEFPIDPNARRACSHRVTHFSWPGIEKLDF